MNNQEPNERSYILLNESHSANSTTEQSNASPQESQSSDSESSDDGKKSSMAITSVNYINGIVGSGVMAMPYVLKLSGLGFGLILMLVVVMITGKSLVLQIAAGKILGTSTYQETVEGVFGKPGFVMCAILQFSFPFLGMVSYNIIIGDTITKVIVRLADLNPNNPWVHRDLVATLVTFLVTLPLSSLRNIVYLSKTSFLSLAMVAFICVTMVIRIPHMLELTPGMTGEIIFIDTGIGPAIGIISFAFVCHQTSFLLYKSLDNNTEARWNKTTYLSLGLALLPCIIIAVSGYVPFTDLTQGDILENYCRKDDLMNACRAIFAISVMFTYPLECFAAREVLETSFFRNHQPPPLWRHLVLTLAIVVAALLLSFTTDCLALVLLLAGIFLACPMAFLIPAATFIKAGGGNLMSKKNASAWFVILFGVVAGLTGFVTLVINWSDVSTCSHGKEMDYCLVNGTLKSVPFI
uniref:Putative sodium-coupled neutral amino acid transporter 11 n=1 Tax=Hirondellea gigas TaxID=1518452 RepID=A0A2P2I2Q8_9CRUS